MCNEVAVVRHLQLNIFLEKQSSELTYDGFLIGGIEEYGDQVQGVVWHGFETVQFLPRSP